MIFGRRFPPPFVQRRPQAARHQPPSPGRHRAASPGRWEGCGAGGPLAPRAAAGTSPPEDHGTGTGTGPGPHPAAGPLGGPPPGEVELDAGGARTQARPPTPRQGGHSQRPGHRPPAERPGGGAAAPRTQAASNETGRRPTTDRGPRRQPPANTNGGEGPRAGAGQGRAAAIGAGAAGPGQYRPGLPTTRPHTFFGPARHLWGRAGHRHGGGPARRALCARDSGRAEGPRGGRMRTRRNEALTFPNWTRLDEKMRGRTLCPPPLAVTAGTRFPPVRRSSPTRIRCRPAPYALAVRRSPGPRSCVP